VWLTVIDIVLFPNPVSHTAQRTNTIFTNIYMTMNGRRHIVHIYNKEKHEWYDLNI